MQIVSVTLIYILLTQAWKTRSLLRPVSVNTKIVKSLPHEIFCNVSNTIQLLTIQFNSQLTCNTIVITNTNTIHNTIPFKYKAYTIFTKYNIVESLPK